MVLPFALTKLTCLENGCRTGFETFEIRDASWEDVERDYNVELLRNFNADFEYPRLVSYCHQLGWADFGLPEELPEGWSENGELCQALYRALFCREIVQAGLACPHCGAQYSVINGVVRMIREQ